LSPPRRTVAAKPVARRRHDSDSDLSPPRADVKVEKDAAAKPAARRQRHDSDSDLSPPRSAPAETESTKRQRHDSDADLSPPRQDAGNEKMSSGLRIGLVSGKDLKDDAAKIRAERKAAIEAAPDEETGRGATTVYRNKSTGAKITREEFVEQSQKKKKKRLSDYPEQELEWGGGIKQGINEEEEKAEVERIAAQPFARFEPDKKYTEELQAKLAWNDPMAKFKDDPDAFGPAAKQEAEKNSRPKCPHTPWMNRFGILPGYRWDGKIRGNEFDKKFLETKNARAYAKEDRWRNAQDDDG